WIFPSTTTRHPGATVVCLKSSEAGDVRRTRRSTHTRLTKTGRVDAMKYGPQIVGALAALAIAGTAQAQNYPSREIKMIVPFPAGGPSDIVARIAADGMSKHLGHNIVIENVGGAGGTVGPTRASE